MVRPQTTPLIFVVEFNHLCVRFVIIACVIHMYQLVWRKKYYVSDEYVQQMYQELFNQKLYERLLRTYQLGSAVRHIIHMPHPPSANATRS